MYNPDVNAVDVVLSMMMFIGEYFENGGGCMVSRTKQSFFKFVSGVKTVKKLEVSLVTDVMVNFETVFLFNPGYSPSR